MSGATHETADAYAAVIATWGGLRVVLCRDGLQWLVQRRKGGGAQRPWRSQHYCITRTALVRLCAASDAPPAVIEVVEHLPENATRFDLDAWREAKAGLTIA